MEYELRFYFSQDEKEELLNRLNAITEIKNNRRVYEKTVQYNHSDLKYNFYSKEIDGRFRLRISKSEEKTVCKLSWKQRVPDFNTGSVNKEIEKEVHILPEEIDDFEYIIDNVMHFKIVESYERYRTTFTNNDVEIALDEYPFGIALEIEYIGNNENPEETVLKYVKELNLDVADSYRLSWDDKYAELCKEQGVAIYSEVTFDKPMPKIL